VKFRVPCHDCTVRRVCLVVADDVVQGRGTVGDAAV